MSITVEPISHEMGLIFADLIDSDVDYEFTENGVVTHNTFLSIRQDVIEYKDFSNKLIFRSYIPSGSPTYTYLIIINNLAHSFNVDYNIDLVEHLYYFKRLTSTEELEALLSWITL